MRAIYQGKAEAVLPQFPDACFDALTCDITAGLSFCISENDYQYQKGEAA